MNIKECKVCGNTESGAEILRCDNCKQIVGCSVTQFFGNGGCIGDQRYKSCPNCGHKGGLLSNWYTIIATIK